MSMFCFFKLPLHYITGSYCTLTPLHLFNNFSYYLLCRLHAAYEPGNGFIHICFHWQQDNSGKGHCSHRGKLWVGAFSFRILMFFLKIFEYFFTSGPNLPQDILNTGLTIDQDNKHSTYNMHCTCVNIQYICLIHSYWRLSFLPGYLSLNH